jgi:hypothetical protein
MSTRNLIVLIVVVVALSTGGAALAVAVGDGGPTPAPEALDQAIHDALSAPPPDGVNATVKFTNNLFPSGALFGQVGSALMSGASGRMWATNDGRGRIELQSESGDVQIVWNTSTGKILIFDASSNTVYTADLPAPPATSSSGTNEVPTLADIDNTLTEIGAHWAVSDAQPTNVGGQPAYQVSVSPKHDGGLLGSLELAWDAGQGTPLHGAVLAQSSDSPVLAFDVTGITYGPVSSSAVDWTPPADAKVVDLGSGPLAGTDKTNTPAVTGLDAVKAAATFPVVAPDSIVGLPRRDVRLVGGDTVLAFYGEGLGGIALVERAADAGSTPSQMSALPTVSLDGLTAHELATQLGTVLEWESNGTRFILAGSLPASAAEAAARDVK